MPHSSPSDASLPSSASDSDSASASNSSCSDMTSTNSSQAAITVPTFFTSNPLTAKQILDLRTYAWQAPEESLESTCTLSSAVRSIIYKQIALEASGPISCIMAIWSRLPYEFRSATMDEIANLVFGGSSETGIVCASLANQLMITVTDDWPLMAAATRIEENHLSTAQRVLSHLSHDELCDEHADMNYFEEFVMAKGTSRLYRVPSDVVWKSQSPKKSLIRIACRYFDTYGPSSCKDFAQWIGLELSIVRSAVKCALMTSDIIKIATTFGNMYINKKRLGDIEDIRLSQNNSITVWLLDSTDAVFAMRQWRNIWIDVTMERADLREIDEGDGYVMCRSSILGIWSLDKNLHITVFDWLEEHIMYEIIRYARQLVKSTGDDNQAVKIAVRQDWGKFVWVIAPHDFRKSELAPPKPASGSNGRVWSRESCV